MAKAPRSEADKKKLAENPDLKDVEPGSDADSVPTPSPEEIADLQKDRPGDKGKSNE